MITYYLSQFTFKIHYIISKTSQALYDILCCYIHKSTNIAFYVLIMNMYVFIIYANKSSIQPHKIM